MDFRRFSCERSRMPIEVKICGLSDPEGMDAALAAGADYVGLVFFPASPRNVSLETAAALARRARGKAAIVALVVDPEDDALAAIAETVQPDILQLHGRESAERVAAIRARIGRPVMKALAVAGAEDLAAAGDYPAADRILLDAKPPRDAARPGGNGLAFDWSLLEGFRPARPWLLSGGLSPENVGAAIAFTRAAGVDVSSGVESAPGRKDPERIAAFVAAARRAVPTNGRKDDRR